VSKFPLDVLQRRVFSFAQANDPDIILGAAFGEDVALTRVGGDILVSHVDPIVGAVGDIGWLAVHVACNDVAAAGVAPRWLLLLVLVPRLEDEELLERIMRDASRVAQEVGASIIEDASGDCAPVGGRHRDGVVAVARPHDCLPFCPGIPIRSIADDLLGDAGRDRPARTGDAGECGAGGVGHAVCLRGARQRWSGRVRQERWDNSLYGGPLRGG
jgi:hypothetical protein